MGVSVHSNAFFGLPIQPEDIATDSFEEARTTPCHERVGPEDTFCPVCGKSQIHTVRQFTLRAGVFDLLNGGSSDWHEFPSYLAEESVFEYATLAQWLSEFSEAKGHRLKLFANDPFTRNATLYIGKEVYSSDGNVLWDDNGHYKPIQLTPEDMEQVRKDLDSIGLSGKDAQVYVGSSGC